METIQVSSQGDILNILTTLNKLLLGAKMGLTVTIKRNRKLKSKEQRGYYWKVLIRTISNGCGYFDYEDHFVHEGLKEQFCPLKRNRVGMLVKSTELLNTKEEEDYHQKCRIWASIERGIFVPLPNEDDNFGEKHRRNSK